MLDMLLGLISLAVCLAMAEIALRIVGFSYQLFPEKIEFGYPDFKTMEARYIEDPDLFWTPQKYQERVAKLIAKPPDVLFMGDSCTEFGTYDREMRSLFKKNYPDRKPKLSRLGVAGWASYQGRRQMERDVARIKPKVATIYYGWNDHWIGFGIEDKNVSRFHSPFWIVLNKLRLAQLGIKAWFSIGKQQRSDIPQRVSLEDYKDNLLHMVKTARENGIVPVLITAPTNQRPGNEPAYLQGRFLANLKDLVPLHQAYIAQVRAVAAETGAPLCDLYNDFAALPQRDQDLKYFKNSGIHLLPEGNQMTGRFLYKCFEREGLLEKIVSAAH